MIPVALKEARYLPACGARPCVEVIAGRMIGVLAELENPGLDRVTRARLMLHLSRLKSDLRREVMGPSG